MSKVSPTLDGAYDIARSETIDLLDFMQTEGPYEDFTIQLSVVHSADGRYYVVIKDKKYEGSIEPKCLIYSQLY